MRRFVCASAIALGLVLLKGPGLTGAALPDRGVSINDACDPKTFNAIGLGVICFRDGGITFQDFIATLTAHQSIGAWHFGPSDTTAQVGQSFVATNHGGEQHTFTRVAAFGGGIVELLNNLAGVPKVAQECTHLEPDDFIVPGASYEPQTITHTGITKFQCCIHPWMRAVVDVE